MSSYVPTRAYQFIWNRVDNTVFRLGVGRYRVRMPLVLAPLADGNMQVSAYGPTPDRATRCSPRCTTISFLTCRGIALAWVYDPELTASHGYDVGR
ncbi:MAG: hypothetical protein ACR2RL_05360 [Gammaproteobacteria bacterium]